MAEIMLIAHFLAMLGLTVALILLAHKLLRLDKVMTELWRDLKISHSRTGSSLSRSEGTDISTSSSVEKP